MCMPSLPGCFTSSAAAQGKDQGMLLCRLSMHKGVLEHSEEGLNRSHALISMSELLSYMSAVALMATSRR